MEILLCRLRPEGREIRRDHIAGDDRYACLFESRDLRGEVVVHDLIAARINEPVAGFRECRRQAALRIAPGIAVGIVWKQSADCAIRDLALPQRQKRGDDVFEAPEEMIGPRETLLRIAVATEEIWLPRAIRSD